jgi:hypothetical protein
MEAVVLDSVDVFVRSEPRVDPVVGLNPRQASTGNMRAGRSGDYPSVLQLTHALRLEFIGHAT